MDPETERIVVIARGRPSAEALVQLHRVLGLGVSEVRRRVDAGLPLLDRGLWLNDHEQVERLLRETLDLLSGVDVELYVVGPDGVPDESTRRAASVVWNMIAASAATPDPLRDDDRR